MCTLNNIIIIYAPPLVFFSTNCDVTVWLLVLDVSYNNNMNSFFKNMYIYYTCVILLYYYAYNVCINI